MVVQLSPVCIRVKLAEDASETLEFDPLMSVDCVFDVRTKNHICRTYRRPDDTEGDGLNRRGSLLEKRCSEQWGEI